MIRIILAVFLLSLSLFSVKAQETDSMTKSSAEKNDSPAVATQSSNQTKIPPGYVRPSSEKRLKRYLNNAVGPFALIGVGFASAIDQADKKPPEWKRNANGFARRFGSNLGESVIQETVTYGLDETFKLDAHFYRSQKRDFSARFKNALLTSFTGRTANGKRVFDPSRIVGTYTGSLIAVNTWYPKRFNSQDGFRRGSQALAFSVGFNFLNEFLFHRK